MDDDQQNEQHGLIAWILGIAVTIAIAVSLLVGIVGSMSKPSTGGGAGAAAAGAGGAAAGASAPSAGAGAGATVPGASLAMVKVYFETASAELPADAADALKSIAQAVGAAAGRKAAISGFHDATGDPEKNVELAKQRAFAVRDRLQSFGLTEAQIELRKPQVTTGDGGEREARRVEIRVE